MRKVGLVPGARLCRLTSWLLLSFHAPRSANQGAYRGQRGSGGHRVSSSRHPRARRGHRWGTAACLEMQSLSCGAGRAPSMTAPSFTHRRRRAFPPGRRRLLRRSPRRHRAGPAHARPEGASGGCAQGRRPHSGLPRRRHQRRAGAAQRRRGCVDSCAATACRVSVLSGCLNFINKPHPARPRRHLRRQRQRHCERSGRRDPVRKEPSCAGSWRGPRARHPRYVRQAAGSLGIRPAAGCGQRCSTDLLSSSLGPFILLQATRSSTSP